MMGFSPGRADIMAALLMFLSILVFFNPVIFTGKVFFFRDVCSEIVPKRTFLAESGLQVIWNPYMFFGLPVAANMQSSVFYLLNFFFHLGSVPLALSYYTIFHFVIALLSTYVLIRSLRGSVTAALAGALAFTYGGFFVSLGNQIVVLNSATWIMALLWAAGRALITGRRGFIIGAGIFWAMQVLGGEPEIAYLSGIILVFFLAGLILGGFVDSSAREALKLGVFIVVAAGALALALSALQWVLTLELAGISNRAGGLSFEDALKWSLEPGSLTTLLAPNYIMDATETKWWVLGFRARELPYLLSVYPGVAALVLILFSIRKSSRAELVFMAGAVLFLLLSLGRYGGFYWLFFHLLPGFDRFRIPERCMYGFAVFFALLVGLAVDYLKNNWNTLSQRLWNVSLRTFYILIILPIIVFLAGVISFFIFSGLPEAPIPADYLSIHNQLTWLSVGRMLVFSGLALIFLLTLRKEDIDKILWAFCLLIFIDLLIAHRHVNPVIDPDFYSLSGHLASGLPDGAKGGRILVAQPESKAETTIGAGRDVVNLYRQERLGLQAFTGLELGIREVGARSSFYPADVDIWIELMPKMQMRLLELGGVRWALRPGFKPIKVEDPLPRAFVVPKARWLSNRDAVIEAMKNSGFDPRDHVLLEGKPLQDTPPRLDNIFWPMKIIRDDNQRVEVLVEPDHPGYLVLLDSYYPGWTARVNGNAAPIYRANGFYRAVPVGSSGGKVEFAYRPIRFYIGLLVSAGSLLGCAVALLRKRLGFLWWVAWIVLLFILPMDDGGTTYIPVTTLRIIVLALATAWAWRLGSRTFPSFLRTKIDIWIVGFLLLAALAMVRSVYFYISSYWYLNIFTLALLFYFTVQFTARGGELGDRRARTILAILVAGYAIQAAWAIGEMNAGFPEASAGFFNPSYLAGALMALSPYILLKGIGSLRPGDGRGWLMAAGWGALFVMFFISVLATQSRAVIIWPLPLVFVVFPAVEGLLLSRGFSKTGARRTTIGVLATSFLIGLAALAVFPNPLRERVLGHKYDPYAFERIGIWKSGLQMATDHPLGVGQGMFKYYYYRYSFPVEGIMAGRYEKRAATAHNEYINAAAEMSVFAPVLLTVPAVLLLWGAWKRGRGSKRESEIMGSAAGIMTIALHALVDSNLHNHSIAVLATVLAGLLVAGLSRTGDGWIIVLEPGRLGILVFRAVLTLALAGGVAGYAFLGWSYGKTLEGSQESNPGMALLKLEESARYAAGNAIHFKALSTILHAHYSGSQNVKFLERAIKAAETANRLNPADPAPIGMRAGYLYELYRISGKKEALEMAHSEYLRALEINPADVDYLMGLALVERGLGKKELEIQALKKIIELEPYDLAARVRLARALVEADRWEEADRQLREFVSRRKEVLKKQRERPDEFNTLYRLKRIKVDQGELRQLEESLKRVIK